MEAKEKDLAYFAGLFDGEGCIHIRKTRTKTLKPTYALVCKISMCSFYLLNDIQGLFGGSLIQERPHKYSNRYNKLWTWTASCRIAGRFLLILRPFLRLKGAEADLALEFQGGKVGGAHKGKWGNNPRGEGELAVEEAQYLLMRNLKQGVRV